MCSLNVQVVAPRNCEFPRSQPLNGVGEITLSFDAPSSRTIRLSLVGITAVMSACGGDNDPHPRLKPPARILFVLSPGDGCLQVRAQDLAGITS